MHKNHTLITTRQFLIRSALVFSLALIGSLFFFADRAPGSDEGVTIAASTSSEQEQIEQGCPTAEYVCETYTNGACEVSAGCEGSDCYTFYRGAEISVISLGDPEDGFTVDWLARHPGGASLTGFVGRPCEVTPITSSFSKTEIPENHCSAELITNKHYYLEFFASNPVSGCHGWVECQCY